MPLRRSRCPAGLLAALLLGTPAGAGTDAGTEEAWTRVAAFLTKEAWWGLRQLPAAEDAAVRRERDFCHAVILLDLPPLTEARLDEAEARLRRLAQSGDDEIAAAAVYLTARSRQLYRERPEPAAAAALYRGLLDRPGAGSWAGQARVKLALLQLYVLPAENPAARLAAARALLAGAAEAPVRRDLHRLLARAGLFYDLDPAAALADLEAAEAIGGLRGAPHADQLVQLAELSWECGRPEAAALHHARLVAEYPRDVRAWGFEQRLAGRPAPARGRFGDAP